MTSAEADIRPAWPPARVALWFVIAALAVVWEARNWREAFWPADGVFADFSQEWLSARNYLTGRPVYSPQGESLELHTGYSPRRAEDMLPWNAHPPAAVMLALPLGRLAYRTAFCIWTSLMLAFFLAALVLALRLRRSRFHWPQLLPITAALAVCIPLLLQVLQGQLNGLLVFLAAAAWWADHRERNWLAGVCIGAATAFKLFPAFLFLYWLMRGKWAALVAGLISFCLLNATAAVLLGVETFTAYVNVVIPSVSQYRSSWGNMSLWGFWLRLFNPEEFERVVPWLRSPQLANALIFISVAAVTGIAAICCRRAVGRAERDRAYALTVIGMLLVSPITWGHYFLMLLIPLAVEGNMPRHRWVRIAYCASLAALWVPLGWFLLIPMNRFAVVNWNIQRYLLPPARPWQSLVGLSIQTYALVFLFFVFSRPTRSTEPET